MLGFIEIKNVVINDGLLKVSLDSEDRWAINFYNMGKLSTFEVFGKFIVLWWWLVLVGISIVYIKIEKD